MRLFKPPHRSQMGSLDREPTAASGHEEHDAASSAVAAMRRATTDLDGILQQLCSAMPKPAEFRPATAVTRVISSSGSEFLQSIEAALKTSRDSAMVVPGRGMAARQESPDFKDPSRIHKLFESGCKDLSVVFQSPLYNAHPEPIRSYAQLKHQIYAQLTACDHLIPADTAICLATSAIDCALLNPSPSGSDIVRAVFLGEASTQVAKNVDWSQGDRVCHIYAQESEQEQQWGIKLAVVVEFTLRAQCKPGNDMKHSTSLDLVVSCTHTLFLRKDDYAKSPCADCIASTQEQRLALNKEEKHSADVSSDPGDQALDSDTLLPPTKLPELLSVFVWGDHERLESVDTTDEKAPPAFRPMANFNTPFPRNRIVQAACSGFHTLLLNDIGLVFSYGRNMDGALGHDRSETRNDYVSSPQLVEFFLDQLISVRAVACAGNLITGAHSAAVSSDGDVFTWGIGIALGNGSSQNLDAPRQIKLPAILDDASSSQLESNEKVKMDSITCGSGYCIALTQDGHAFAWGKWGDGRLGLGRIPILNRSSRRHGNRRQVKSFQLLPVMLPGQTFLKVSCGDAHCIGLTRQHQLVTWGRGGHGQLGRGSLLDALSPIAVACEQTKWMDVSAGEDWSTAVDDQGRVWSWGACGSSVLGHGRSVSNTRSTTVLETILERHQRVATTSSPDTTEPLASPVLPQLSWMTPRLVPTFASGDVRIQSLSSGRQHAAAVSDAGDLYLWGDGDGFNHYPSLVCGGQPDTNDSQVCSRIVEHVVCGGSQVFAFVSGSFLASSLRQTYQQCLQLSPFASDFHTSCRSLGVDIVLLSSTSRLYVHKVVLARRSAVFREMILNEQRDQREASDAPMELLLPHIRADVARILVEFMYTDNVSCKLDPQAYLIRDVLRAAQLYQLPNLEQLCTELIAAAANLSLSLFGSLSNEDGDANQQENLTKRSLNGDMQYAFGDSTWTDLTLVAESKEIRVHRCMLVARSEYFRALLAFQDKVDDANASGRATIVVDESYVGLLRVLNFIYHDHVQPEEVDDEQLLEDLITADKYGLARMKRLCEHSIRITLVNCLEVLAVADMVPTAHLKQSALAFIQSNLQLVVSESSFQSFKAAFPHLLRELYEAIRASSRDDFALHEWQQAVDAQWRLQQGVQQREWTAKTDAAGKFPFLSLVLTLVFATLYLLVMRLPAADYPLVPAVNFLALGGLLVVRFYEWV